MADVSVEFGAQDVGLEKTLKTIQAEMSDLQGKVKSGELSFDELERTMRKSAKPKGWKRSSKPSAMSPPERDQRSTNSVRTSK